MLDPCVGRAHRKYKQEEREKAKKAKKKEGAKTAPPLTVEESASDLALGQASQKKHKADAKRLGKATAKATAKSAPSQHTSAAQGKAKSKAKATAKAEAAAERFCEPCISMERSRSQVLCRTGLRGSGQSWTLKYGPGQAYRDEAAALKAAKAWLAGVQR